MKGNHMNKKIGFAALLAALLLAAACDGPENSSSSHSDTATSIPDSSSFSSSSSTPVSDSSDSGGERSPASLSAVWSGYIIIATMAPMPPTSLMSGTKAMTAPRRHGPRRAMPSAPAATSTFRPGNGLKRQPIPSVLSSKPRAHGLGNRPTRSANSEPSSATSPTTSCRFTRSTAAAAASRPTLHRPMPSETNS